MRVPPYQQLFPSWQVIMQTTVAGIIIAIVTFLLTTTNISSITRENNIRKLEMEKLDRVEFEQKCKDIQAEMNSKVSVGEFDKVYKMQLVTDQKVQKIYEIIIEKK